MNKSVKVDSFNKASVIFALSVVLGTVAYAWTGAPVGTPPANNVEAPVNVGNSGQVKSGYLGVQGLLKVYTSFKFEPGAGEGKILTSDAEGYASWQTPSLSSNGTVKVGTVTGVCDSTTGGTLRYNTSTRCIEFCDETSWKCTNQTATPPAPCSASTQNNCTLPSSSSGASVGSCSSGSIGSCNYSCNNGVWTQNSNTCQPACSATTISGCTLSSTPYGAASGSCSSGYSGSCNYSCNAGTWTKESNTCCPTSFYHNGTSCVSLYTYVVRTDICGGSGECFDCYRRKTNTKAGYVASCYTYGVCGSATAVQRACYNIFGNY